MMEQLMIVERLLLVRKWKWARAIAHWILMDPIAHLKQRVWWRELERCVRSVHTRTEWDGVTKHKKATEQFLLDLECQGKQPPRQRDINTAIEILLQGW